jgi:hypothetical protein
MWGASMLFDLDHHDVETPIFSHFKAICFAQVLAVLALAAKTSETHLLETALVSANFDGARMRPLFSFIANDTIHL